MKKKKYCGVVPAFYACYDKNGDIDAKTVKKYARYLVDKGVNGLYVNGSTGEGLYLTVSERKKIIEAVMDEVGGEIPVINHVACNSTRESMELAAHSEKTGVDAIAAIPPIYFHLPDSSIADYWNLISSAAPNTDFFIYNIPQLAGVGLSDSLLKTMMKNPRVKGVKNSSMPILDIEREKAAGGDDFIVFNGSDEQYVGGRAIGADGGIGSTYSVMPELYLEIEKCLETGDLIKAQKIQHTINNVIFTAGKCSCHFNAAMHELFKRVSGIDVGGVRGPLSNITESDLPVLDGCAKQILDVRY